MGKSLALGLILVAAAFAAALEADTLEMVKAFLRVPTESLPPDSIGRFISVESKELPKELRKPFEAKKLELLTLRSIVRAQKKGSFRRPEPDCSPSDSSLGQKPDVLKMAGFVEIRQEEVNYLVKETQCTEEQLMCEFTLTIAVEIKGKKKWPRYFLHANDALFSLIAKSRSSQRKDSDFFSSRKPTCYR